MGVQQGFKPCELSGRVRAGPGLQSYLEKSGQRFIVTGDRECT
ncbi:hypothetical protein OHAE_5298 [Ochrobactrum soli]|uniref:Uncharacterized protein n=1 Tax=Ochrobactrum soli TaxID=2448455 RepID=A0A2P9HF18_9HYPH|nr:hypothetical protein OHAE_5298 [[Ochrobactrum] soli]